MSKRMTRGLHACASIADMLGGLELIMGSTTRTKLAGSSHGGSTGRGGVRQAHWLTSASFEKSRDLCRWGGARIVESAADGGIVHTRDATCTTRLVSQRNCQLLHEVVTMLSVLFRGGLTLTPY